MQPPKISPFLYVVTGVFAAAGVLGLVLAPSTGEKIAWVCGAFGLALIGPAGIANVKTTAWGAPVRVKDEMVTLRHRSEAPLFFLTCACTLLGVASAAIYAGDLVRVMGIREVWLLGAALLFAMAVWAIASRGPKRIVYVTPAGVMVGGRKRRKLVWSDIDSISEPAPLRQGRLGAGELSPITLHLVMMQGVRAPFWARRVLIPVMALDTDPHEAFRLLHTLHQTPREGRLAVLTNWESPVG